MTNHTEIRFYLSNENWETIVLARKVLVLSMSIETLLSLWEKKKSGYLKRWDVRSSMEENDRIYLKRDKLLKDGKIINSIDILNQLFWKIRKRGNYLVDSALFLYYRNFLIKYYGTSLNHTSYIEMSSLFLPLFFVFSWTLLPMRAFHNRWWS